MASISDEQRTKIIALLHEGRDRDEIASLVGVSPGTVSAIKAHITMGTYGVLTSEGETDELIEASEVSFGLERDLQRALRLHIQQLESGLEIVDGGTERTTAAGRIDITAADQNGAIVVIELKAGTASPDALTQLLAYMGAIGNEDKKPVRGILVANDFHPRIVFAVRAISNVQLCRYCITFKFDPVE